MGISMEPAAFVAHLQGLLVDVQVRQMHSLYFSVSVSASAWAAAEPLPSLISICQLASPVLDSGLIAIGRTVAPVGHAAGLLQPEQCQQVRQDAQGPEFDV